MRVELGGTIHNIIMVSIVLYTTDPFSSVCRCGGEGAGNQCSLQDHCQPHPLLPQYAGTTVNTQPDDRETALLAVCMMWRLAKSRRRHIPSAGQWSEVIL